MRSTKLLLSIALAILAAPAVAAAQVAGLPAASSGGSVARDLDMAQKRAYWSGGKTRSFVLGTLEGGIFYYRPQLAIGYGKPHWHWFGAESQTRFSIGSASQYFGVRGALPNVELRLGSRYSWAANESYLDRRDAYTDDQIGFDDNQNSRYVTGEAELTGFFPFLGGAITFLATSLYVAGVPEKLNVFENQLHVVAQAPWLWRTRAGYVRTVFVDGLQLGAAAEVIGNPEREHLVVRVGPQLGAALTHHLDASLSIMAVVASRDSLHLKGNDIGQFGFRYRWASGDPFPEFP